MLLDPMTYNSNIFLKEYQRYKKYNKKNTSTIFIEENIALTLSELTSTKESKRYCLDKLIYTILIRLQ